MVDEQVKDLFGSDSDDEAPQAEKARAGGDEAQAERQAGKAAATNLFGSSDEDDEPPGASHPVTQALGEDEDEYPARCRSPARLALPPSTPMLCFQASIGRCSGARTLPPPVHPPLAAWPAGAPARARRAARPCTSTWRRLTCSRRTACAW